MVHMRTTTETTVLLTEDVMLLLDNMRGLYDLDLVLKWY